MVREDYITPRKKAICPLDVICWKHHREEIIVVRPSWWVTQKDVKDRGGKKHFWSGRSPFPGTDGGVWDCDRTLPNGWLSELSNSQKLPRGAQPLLKRPLTIGILQNWS